MGFLKKPFNLFPGEFLDVVTFYRGPEISA
jgi:hypothetical protein